MAGIKAVELVFVGPAAPCAQHQPCACSYVLVDVHTSSPVFADPVVFSPDILAETAASLEAVGGTDRLVIFFVAFLRQRRDGSGLHYEREHSYVHYEFVAWGHDKTRLGAGCACALCREVLPIPVPTDFEACVCVYFSRGIKFAQNIP